MKTILQSLALFFIALGFAVCEAQEVVAERDVSYGDVGGEKLLLDVFRPASPAAALRPAVILVHGGGWSAGSKEAFTDAAKGLAQNGCVAFSINYRLASNGRNCWPAQLDDAQRAARWVRANAEKYGIDPKRIGAIGHSAGGHLVVCLGTRETRDNSDASLAPYSSRVTCVVDMSGPVDLVNRENSQGDGIVRNLLGGTPADRPEAARDASPLYSVDAKSAPFLIIHGRLDELVHPHQAERLDAALRTAGVESKLVVFEDEGHGISKKENADRMIRETLEFLQKHLAP
jgi:acetyl esterase/lipase